MIYALYTLLFGVAIVLGSPYIFLRQLFRPTERTLWRHRLGALPALRPERPSVWIHAVSVGEALAAAPLIAALARDFPALSLVLSTVTQTGYRLAHARYSSVATIVFFPLDWPPFIARALRRLHPALVLIMETEIWPNLLRACARRDIPIVLVNGRISNRSFRRYRWIRPFMARVLANFRLLLVQSEEDARRLRALGAASERIHVVGNLKWDALPPADEAERAEDLARRLGLSPDLPVVVAGSTAAGEELLILRAFRKARERDARLRQARLIIAPRRPERFDEVEKLLKASGASVIRRTRADDPSATSRAEVILLDTLGELALFYRIARVAIIGGSFSAAMAHNVIEPLVRGACVIVGPRYSDPPLGAYSSCVWRIPSPSRRDDADAALEEALAHALSRLLTEDEVRARLQTEAHHFLRTHRGTTERILSHLTPLLAELSVSGT